MIYIKSALTGLLAVIASIVLFPLIGLPIYARFARPSGMEVGWDVVDAAKSPTVCFLVLLIFGCAFYWKWRRLSK